MHRDEIVVVPCRSFEVKVDQEHKLNYQDHQERGPQVVPSHRADMASDRCVLGGETGECSFCLDYDVVRQRFWRPLPHTL